MKPQNIDTFLINDIFCKNKIARVTCLYSLDLSSCTLASLPVLCGLFPAIDTLFIGITPFVMRFISNSIISYFHLCCQYDQSDVLLMLFF